jgi:hypothetical protein
MGKHAKGKVAYMRVLSRGNALTYPEVSHFQSWQFPGDEHGNNGSFRLGVFYAP